jgi:hypothetical protein
MLSSENRAFAIFGRDAQSKNPSASWRFTPSQTRGVKGNCRSLVLPTPIARKPNARRGPRLAARDDSRTVGPTRKNDPSRLRASSVGHPQNQDAGLKPGATLKATADAGRRQWPL